MLIMKTPKFMPNRTTVKLTRKEVMTALFDYITKHSPNRFPSGAITILVDQKGMCGRLSEDCEVKFVIEKSLE